MPQIPIPDLPQLLSTQSPSLTKLPNSSSCFLLPSFLSSRDLLLASLYVSSSLATTFCKCLPTLAHWLLPFCLLSSAFLSTSLLGSEPLLLLLHLSSSIYSSFSPTASHSVLSVLVLLLNHFPNFPAPSNSKRNNAKLQKHLLIFLPCSFAFLPSNNNNNKTSGTFPFFPFSSSLFPLSFSLSLSLYQNHAAPIPLIQIVDVEKRRDVA